MKNFDCHAAAQHKRSAACKAAAREVCLNPRYTGISAFVPHERAMPRARGCLDRHRTQNSGKKY